MLRHFYTDDHNNYQWNQNHPQDRRSLQQTDNRKVAPVQFEDVDQALCYYRDHRHSSNDETMCVPTVPNAPNSRRYSLSHGSDYFPTMSPQELDKIDATQHHFSTRACYTPLDPRLFDDDRRADRVDMFMTSKSEKNIGIDDSNRCINSMYKKANYNVAEADFRMTKVPQFEQFSSNTSSRRNSLCSLSDSYFEDDISLLPHGSMRLDNSMRERTWNEFAQTQMTSCHEAIEYPDYSYQLYEPMQMQPPGRVAFNHQQHEEYEMSESIAPESVDYNPDCWTQMMESLATSMGETFKSQQSIHDWDKKMGLKRSHSKTMRMSMRTRKKLRTLIKKELGY
jgi:hypothetical protein